MKKFIITFIILLILAGTAFMFGWVQFSVPAGKYGVIVSKTHGIDSKLVRSGEFRWLWYKLIPTNVKIRVFDLEYNKFPIHFSSTLPSAVNYAAFAGITNADFSWDISGEVSFGIDPQMLVSLVSRHNMTNQEELNEYINTISKDIDITILRSLSSASDNASRIERILSGGRDIAMEKEIKDKYPEILDFSIIIHSVKYPDFVLYSYTRQLYDDFLATQREHISASYGVRAENHISTQQHFSELERYGELLTKYPILLDYLALEKRQ